MWSYSLQYGPQTSLPCTAPFSSLQITRRPFHGQRECRISRRDRSLDVCSVASHTFAVKPSRHQRTSFTCLALSTSWLISRPDVVCYLTQRFSHCLPPASPASATLGLLSSRTQRFVQASSRRCVGSVGTCKAGQPSPKSCLGGMVQTLPPVRETKPVLTRPHPPSQLPVCSRGAQPPTKPAPDAGRYGICGTGQDGGVRKGKSSASRHC